MLFLAVTLLNPLSSFAQAGFVDPSFLNGLTGPNSWLWALALQPDGKVLLGGQFTSFNGVPRNQIVRLNWFCSSVDPHDNLSFLQEY